MSYTAKTWRTLNDFKVNDLNSLERGVQEAHEGVDLLRKDFTTTKIAQDKAISQINSLLNQSGTALQAIKDIENILVSDKELSEILKNYGTEFLSKEPQSLSNDELKNVYKNLKLNEYKLFTSVTINGEEVIGNSLDIKSPKLDTILNRSSNNAVTNAAITQALENFSSPDINRYLNIHNESTTAHANLRDQINSKASIDYVNDAIKNIPVPDVSKQISEHNSDTTSHQDIRDMLNNLDLSGYAKEDHTHDNYLPLSGGKMTGNLTGKYITGTWLQSTSHTNLNTTPTTYPVFDSNGWIYSRTLAEMKEDLGVPTDYATSSHNHDGVYAPTIHSHNYATQSDIDNAIANIELPEIDFDGLATEDFVSDLIKDLASTSYVDGAISNHTNDGNAHSDIRNSVTKIQTSVNTINGLLSSFAKSDDVVKKSGDTMSGTLTIGNITLNPTTNTIATKNLSLTNLSESSSTSKLVVLDSNNNAQYRSLTGLKSDLNITNDINTAVQGVKDWLLGTGNANTIDTIKDIADIMEEHKDVLDTLGNTYALKGHNHDGVYAPVHDHPYASNTHNHDSAYAAKSHTHTEYAKISGGNTFTGVQHIKGTAGSKPFWVRGIQGCLEDGVTENELHLNYQSNHPVKWGYDANGQLNSDGTITEAGTLLSDKYAPKSHTHSYLPLSGGTLTGNLAMNNCNITGVNNIQIADQGAGEGIEWLGGNNWKIYESSNSLDNTTGNLQFVTGSTRRMTIDTNGIVEATVFLGRLRGIDTRNEAQSPSQYMANNGITEYQEFKSASVIGSPNSNGNGFVYAKTFVPWSDPSGGLPTQLSVGNGLAYRTATSETAWGSWYHVPQVLKGTSSTKASNTTSVKTLRLGLVGSTLYIWTS